VTTAVTRRILTGEGMGILGQLRRRVVPCPECFSLRPIESFKVTKKGGRPARKTITIECREHGRKSILWEAIVNIVQQRQEFIGG
jgi:hypothetical protein